MPRQENPQTSRRRRPRSIAVWQASAQMPERGRLQVGQPGAVLGEGVSKHHLPCQHVERRLENEAIVVRVDTDQCKGRERARRHDHREQAKRPVAGTNRFA
jgi:hypothetical protein